MLHTTATAVSLLCLKWKWLLPPLSSWALIWIFFKMVSVTFYLVLWFNMCMLSFWSPLEWRLLLLRWITTVSGTMPAPSWSFAQFPLLWYQWHHVSWLSSHLFGLLLGKRLCALCSVSGHLPLTQYLLKTSCNQWCPVGRCPQISRHFFQASNWFV